jgi:hypothetical protein
LTATLPSPAVLLTPPELGLARLSITGFSALKAAEQLQAAALALRRELSIEPAPLRLAVATAADSGDVARVAFCTTPVDPAKAQPVATVLLAAMRRGQAFWVGAPGGFIVTEQGAATVDFAAADDQLPAVVTDILSAMDASASAECVLVNRDRARVSDERLAWWSAASGVAMVDGALPSSAPVLLATPPRARIAPLITRLDRALQVGAVAAILCAVLAGVRYATISSSNAPSMTASSTNAITATHHAAPGALLERIGSIAPDVVLRAQSATFASGTWVLALPEGMDASAVSRATRAMQANGLLAQSTNAPTPRIRVQLP